MASTKDKSVTTSNDDVLKKALKRFQDSWDYQKDQWHDLWERDNKLYAGERHIRAYEGLADTFVPMTQPMIETITSALANGTLRFDYTSGDPLKDPDMRTLNGLIDEYAEADQWDLKDEESEREMLVTGMCGNMLSWDIDRPIRDVYAMRDIIVDPTIVTPADLQRPGAYAGRRYYIRKGSLDDFEVIDVDPKSKTYGELVKRYNIPAETGNPTGKNTDEDTDRMNKEMFANSTLKNASDDQDEVIEVWDVDRVVTILNRKHVIENVVNPYKQRHEDLLTQKYAAEMTEQFGMSDVFESTMTIAQQEAESQAKLEAKGIVPFFFFRNYRRVSTFYAKSEIDAVAKHQELINDLTNLETDQLIKQTAGQRELDPEYEDWLDIITEDPSVVYPFKPGSLMYIQQPNTGSNNFANRQNLKNEYREATAISQRSKGIESPTDPTATEVRSSDKGTDQRIESKARTLEKDAYYWFAKILFRMIQLYVTKPMVVKVSGPSTRGKETGEYRGVQLPPSTAVFDPADFEGDFEPTISLEVDSKQKKIESQKEALQQFQLLVQDPTNNLAKVKEIFYPKILDLDKADLDDILTQDPSQMATMQGMPTGGEPQPGAAL